MKISVHDTPYILHKYFSICNQTFRSRFFSNLSIKGEVTKMIVKGWPFELLNNRIDTEGIEDGAGSGLPG